MYDTIIKVESQTTKNGVSPNVLKIGQIGKVISGEFGGNHILRTYAGLVLLENPKATWNGLFDINGTKGTTMLVDILPVGTRLTLELLT